MSKKCISLEYQTPLEFIATYTKKGYEGEKEELERLTGKSILELIAMEQDHESDFWNLLIKIEEFANGCGLEYCYECDVFHKYETCPFCALSIKLD